MKRALITAGGLIVLFVIFLSINELTGGENEIKNTATSSPDPDEFLIGAYSAGCSPNNVMNQLGLNIRQKKTAYEFSNNCQVQRMMGVKYRI